MHVYVLVLAAIMRQVVFVLCDEHVYCVLCDEQQLICKFHLPQREHQPVQELGCMVCYVSVGCEIICCIQS